jgi:hypothetical protein
MPSPDWDVGSREEHRHCIVREIGTGNEIFVRVFIPSLGFGPVVYVLGEFKILAT